MPRTGLESASHPSPSTPSVRFPDRSQTTLNRSCNGGASRPAARRVARLGHWGNIGAVCWGMMFKFGYIGRFSKGYEAMGYIIIASSIFSIFMRIKGQKTMFGTLEDQ